MSGHKSILKIGRLSGAERAALIALAVFFAVTPHASHAQNCTATDFAAAVDRSGAQLREYNAKMGPDLLDSMRRYAKAKNIPDDQAEDAAFEAIQDDRLRSLDEQSAGLLLKIDSLGRIAEGAKPDCANLNEITTASAVLLSVMRQKTEYMQQRIVALTAEPEGPKTAAKPLAEKPKAKVAGKTAEKPPEPKAAPAQQAPSSESWETDTKPSNDAYSPLPEVALNVPPATAGATPALEDGYSIDEIRDATRGFFGTVSTNLASVLEHAFKTSGRPTAYVLGTEGGGAFLAGLRFGKGTLFLRDRQETRQIYWHGPSIGTDFGASGSRTMFLIYKLRDPAAIYRSFTGVDGSAFFVGGVGVTLLKGGDVIMAPIRSGLGFRLGANLGYVSFTDRPTWNPF